MVAIVMAKTKAANQGGVDRRFALTAVYPNCEMMVGLKYAYPYAPTIIPEM